MRDKLQSLLKELNQGLVEREEIIKLALLSVLAGENIVLIGPPGTGKSLVARRIAECFKGGENTSGDYFEYLLTKFSTPEEIFGPLSISELKQDRFKRNTNGYLPSVRVAFLDEIFKASSSILNSLLTILNERLYHNGSLAEKVQLQSLIAASNELPSEQEELNALYDRFLVRRFVDYVREENLSKLFDVTTENYIQNRLSASELKNIARDASAVAIPVLVRQIIEQIWQEHRKLFKEDRREQLSDRRFVKILGLLRISAATNGRKEVDLSDVMLLKNCLWNHPDNSSKVSKLIQTLLQQHSLTLPRITTEEEPLIATEEALPSSLITSQRQLQWVIPGYTGSGTEEDPILISNLDDLLGLDQAEVGLMGYHFCQTADIDISSLSSWPTIIFHGHYDGGCFAVKGRDNNESLFSNIRSGSSIRQLKLIDCSLANTVDKTDILHCGANVRLIKKTANACKINACLVNGIVNDAYGCSIEACGSSNILITNTATKCSITFCHIVLNLKSSLDEDSVFESGFIARNLRDSSVNACFVSGDTSSRRISAFSGIAAYVDSSSISQCMVGPLQIFVAGSLRFGGVLDDTRKIFGISKNLSSGFQKNYILDSVDKSDNVDTPNAAYGGQLATVRFNQRFLENTLSWDFVNVWEWNDVTGLPTLRNIGVQAGFSAHREKPDHPGNLDLLARQISRNIWLSTL